MASYSALALPEPTFALTFILSFADEYFPPIPNALLKLQHDGSGPWGDETRIRPLILGEFSAGMLSLRVLPLFQQRSVEEEEIILLLNTWLRPL